MFSRQIRGKHAVFFFEKKLYRPPKNRQKPLNGTRKNRSKKLIKKVKKDRKNISFFTNNYILTNIAIIININKIHSINNGNRI